MIFLNYIFEIYLGSIFCTFIKYNEALAKKSSSP